MLDKNGPPFPAKLTGFGHPFHGLVESGQLTLPNSQTISYPQPSSGDTYHVKVPGIAPISRTPEQQSLDTAAGYQWWNEAIMSGAERQLYGTSMQGRWIYIDGNGDRWAVEFPEQAYSIDVPFSETVSLYRFGHFSPAEERYDYTASLSDLGQSAPDIPEMGGSVTSGSIFVVSTTPSGDQAILVIAAMNSSDPFGKYTPLGYLLLSITGAGSAANLTLSVLRDRSQTIGSYSDQAFPSATTKYAAFYTQVSETFANVPGCGNKLVERETTPHTTGWQSDTNHPDVGPTAFFSVLDQPNGTMWSSLSGKIIAMWFDGTTIEEIVLDMHAEATITTGLPSLSVSGSVITTYTYDGNCDASSTTTDNMEMEGSRHTELTESVTWTLTRGTDTATFTITSTTITDDYGDWRTNDRSRAFDQAGGVFGDSISDISGVNSWADDDIWPSVGGGEITAPFSQILNGSPIISVSYAQQRWALNFLRASNHVMAANITTFPDPASHPSDWWIAPYHSSLENKQSEFFYPGGIDAAQATLTGPHIYGSWNPVTGQIARGYNTQVCWV